MSRCERPNDIGANEQMGWLATVLGAPPARILDAGCGRGDLARRLSGLGFDVVGVDSDRANVDEAQSRGAPVVLADFTTYEDDPFDVVVFSRSLHHIQPLSEAVARALSLLRPGGQLVADEFSVDWIDRDTASWFYDTLSLLQADGVLTPSHRVPSSGDPLERWHRHHEEDPPMSGGDAMIQAVRNGFEDVAVSRSPYLYHYLGGWLEESERGCRIAQTLLEIESRRIDEDSLTATGLRMVGRRPA